ETCELSFETIKKMLTEKLRLHIFDPTAKTFVTADASDVATLSQIQGGKEKPIAFFNKTLSQAERNYVANEKEALACLRACEHWENFLVGFPFTLRTDHQALVQLLKNPQGKLQSSKFHRWMERLQHFDYDVQYVPGSQNEVADYLSRIKERAASFDRGADTSMVNGMSSGAIKGIHMDDIREASQRDEDIQSQARLASCRKSILGDGSAEESTQSPQIQGQLPLQGQENHSSCTDAQEDTSQSPHWTSRNGPDEAASPPALLVAWDRQTSGTLGETV
ncbi:MAG: hypothetical protein GY696_04175, partial [Gammaproteobacteria bacterium]|nr:hypothetical protein [Gammaproteobacteria bacterium]